jgi:hypothetical protein
MTACRKAWGHRFGVVALPIQEARGRHEVCHQLPLKPLKQPLWIHRSPATGADGFPHQELAFSLHVDQAGNSRVVWAREAGKSEETGHCLGGIPNCHHRVAGAKINWLGSLWGQVPSAQSSRQGTADFGRAKDVISPTVADKANVNGIPPFEYPADPVDAVADQRGRTPGGCRWAHTPSAAAERLRSETELSRFGPANRACAGQSGGTVG